MITTVTKEQHQEATEELLKWYRDRLMPYAGDTYLWNVLLFIKRLVEEKENDLHK